MIVPLTLPWLDSGKPVKVAVVGDVILDEYLDGIVKRISPEAPSSMKRTICAARFCVCNNSRLPSS